MKFRTIALIVIGFIAGSVFGAWVFSLSDSKISKYHSFDVRQVNTNNTLTNPLLECAELPETISIGTRISLEEDVRSLMEKRKQAGAITDAAIYFRDLNNGPWFGISEDKPYNPASLLKLPLAMSFFWKAAENPGVLEQEIEYAGTDIGDVEFGQAFGPARHLEKGKIYTVRTLIDIMLQQSSNEAALVLSQIAGQEQLLKIYQDFGIAPPQYGQDYTTSVHTFSSFFRILYNATYLDHVASEKILESMTRSTFTQGIAAGVPENIRVSHKFGTRQLDTNGLGQLHDCGIVYAPGKPYILCVMTQGKDFNQLADFLKEISALVYSEVGK